MALETLMDLDVCYEKKIMTEVKEAQDFYMMEDLHQQNCSRGCRMQGTDLTKLSNAMYEHNK